MIDFMHILSYAPHHMHSHHMCLMNHITAPNNTAFEDLFEAVPGVDEYLTDPMNKGVLQDILKLHVSPANADSVILKESAEPFEGTIKIRSLTEDYIMVTVSGDDIMINDSNVVSPLDIIANNGKICSMISIISFVYFLLTICLSTTMQVLHILLTLSSCLRVLCSLLNSLRSLESVVKHTLRQLTV